MTIILKGVVGSTAYGLSTPDSDVDMLGVFAAPTEKVLGLHPGKDSVVTTKPDMTLHEAKKFVSLCLNGNPSVSELLWLDKYEETGELGQELVNIRHAFPSAPRVRDAYLGYAVQQFNRLLSRGDGSFSADTRKRTEKHARHMVRLVEQGFHLYVTGELVVDLRGSASTIDPEWVFQMGRSIAEDSRVAEDYMQQAREKFEYPWTSLPDKPDEAVVEEWLIKVRRTYWEKQ